MSVWKWKEEIWHGADWFCGDWEPCKAWEDCYHSLSRVDKLLEFWHYYFCSIVGSIFLWYRERGSGLILPLALILHYLLTCLLTNVRNFWQEQILPNLNLTREWPPQGCKILKQARWSDSRRLQNPRSPLWPNKPRSCLCCRECRASKAGATICKASSTRPPALDSPFTNSTTKSLCLTSQKAKAHMCIAGTLLP